MTRTTRPKHLLSAEELGTHAGATADDLIQGRREGNGLRVHAIYIVIVSVVALALLVGSIALASSMMS